jgi:transposase
MEVSPFLPLCDELEIEQVNELSNRLLIQIASRSSRASCPLCGVLAERIHSRDIRGVVDLPSVGRPVTLLLTVRKFFCPNAACSRKIFAEQFPALVHSSARMTNRQSQL